MRAVLDSSWRWLSDADRQVIRGLSVFVGGFTLDAAAAVAGATLANLASLAERSLINRVPLTDGTTRYGMHELVRQYAGEIAQRETPPEIDDLSRRHLAYFVTLAERAKPEWDGAQEAEWLQRLRREDANFDVALSWGLEHQASEQVLRLTAAHFRVWIYSSVTRDQRSRLDRVLGLPWDAGSPISVSARARTLNAKPKVVLRSSHALSERG